MKHLVDYYVLKKQPVLVNYYQLADFAYRILSESDFDAFENAMNALGVFPDCQECPEDKIFAMRMMDAIEAVRGCTAIYPAFDCRLFGKARVRREFVRCPDPLGDLHLDLIGGDDVFANVSLCSGSDK